MIDRYGEAIERDLADRGWDMAQLWRDRRFRFLLNIIDGLPRASHVGQAQADDDKAVDLSAKPSGVWRPSVRHYDEAAIILTAIQAGIEKLIAVSAEKYKPDLILPPLTANDRATAKRSRENAERLSKKLGFN